MVVAGVVLALAGVAFLLVCCLVAGSQGNENEKKIEGGGSLLLTSLFFNVSRATQYIMLRQIQAQYLVKTDTTANLIRS